VKIPLPLDFDLAWALRFLADRTVPSLEAISDREYLRSLRIAGRPVVLALRFQRGRNGRTFLEARSSPVLSDQDLQAVVSRLFDLDADLAAFRSMAAADPLLRDLVPCRPGLRLLQYIDPFEGIARAIVGQLVNVGVASLLVHRLTERFGKPAPPLDGTRFLSFPSPEAVEAAGPNELAAVGLTRAKAAALYNVAQAVLDGRLDWDRLRTAPPEETQAALLALPGIGPWTASYVRMRTLGDRDAFPASDLGVVKAMRALTPQGEGITAKEIAVLGERWRPWRAYAILHLWGSL
jgi:AraC family transcriptional regulator, regulatory protein of adaptative response / DNA-3-methyladenine glycosylase II